MMAEADAPLSGEFWTQKMGPMPLWAWGGAVGGGLGYFLYRQRLKTGTVNAADSTAGSSDTGYGTTRAGVGGVLPTTGGIATDVVTSTTPKTNHEWSIKAQNMLVAMGFDPATVAIALQNYLGGNNLTAQQQAIISEGLRSAGPTPEPVPPAVNPAPTPTPTPVPDPPPAGGGGGKPYEPPQAGWDAEKNVGGQGSNGVGIAWSDLAVKALSSNTKYNPYNVAWMAREMKARNPEVARQFPTHVPLYRVPTFIVPKVVGLNWK